MYRLVAAAVLCAILCSCAGTVDKVMADFGLKDRPEGYVGGSDRVMDQLNTVGAMEMGRMNVEGQRGEVKFQRDGDVRGKYYKEVKRYVSFVPTDARPLSRSSMGDGGYAGYLDYTYRIYQSPRVDTSAEAATLSASIATDETGRETYRYTFGQSGQWNGGKGERARR